MRRIQLKPLQPIKSTKEDVTKSQTYQQFMKNMEHELQRLEEVEQPNSIGKFVVFYVAIFLLFPFRFFFRRHGLCFGLYTV